MLLNFYKLLNIISIFLFFIIPKKKYFPESWYYKSFLVILITFIILNFSNNKITNVYIIPLLIFLNILILLYIQYTIDKSNYVSYFLILSLLFTFPFKSFIMKKGIMINPNKKWIIFHIIILSIWYMLLSSRFLPSINKITLLILILYPLIYPIEEYFIHRVSALCLLFILHWSIKS